MNSIQESDAMIIGVKLRELYSYTKFMRDPGSVLEPYLGEAGNIER